MSLIGFDMSGTAVNTSRGLHRLVERIGGITIPAVSFGKHLIGEKFPSTTQGEDPKVFTIDVYEEAKRVFFETQQFERYAKAMKDFEGTIGDLVAMGHTLAMITNARNLEAGKVEQWWKDLDWPDHKPPPCDFIFAHQEGTDKPSWLSACDVVVDDDPSHLVDLVVIDRENLYLILPDHGTAGSKVRKRPTDLVECIAAKLTELGKEGDPVALAAKIVSVRGWSGFMLEFSRAQKVAA